MTALEDPFLADAIEGYEKNDKNAGDYKTDLEELRSRLQSRPDTKEASRVIPFFKRTWWNIAAMVLVIAGAVSLIYYLSITEHKADELVITSNKTRKQTIVLTDTAKDTTIQIDSAAVAHTNRPRMSRAKALSEPVTTNHEDAPVTMQAPSPTIAGESSAKQPDSLATFNKAEDRVASASESSMLRSKQANVSFDENTRKKEESLIKQSTVQDAAPVIGFPAFNRYIADNKRIPGDSLNMHGDVTVSFIVNEDSTLTDFKIEKSFSKRADNEALRLIKEGPRWKTLRNQKALATFTVKF